MRTGPAAVTVGRAALALGLVSSLALAIAAFAAFGNSTSAGWSHLEDLAARARGNVREAWTAVTRVDGERGLDPESPVFRLDPPPTLAPAPEPRPSPEPAPQSLFAVLFAASERAELAQQDLAEALSLVAEAAEKSAPAPHVAAARLRAIQLAVRLRKFADARAQWAAVESTVPPDVALGDTSTRLLCGLAVLPAIPAEEREAALEPLVLLWTENGLVLPAAHLHLAPQSETAGPLFAWSRSPRELALRERLLEACGRPPAWLERFATCDADAARSAFLELVGALPETGLATESWTLSPAAGALLAVRLDPTAQRLQAGPQRLGQLVRRSAVEHALQEELRLRRALPAGFALDPRGDDAALGEMVGSGIDLGPALPRAALRHPDVPGVRREAEARVLWLRGGLLLLALFVAGAAVATFQALRRERRLSEARTAFIANVSHELRTPLASILLMAENLEQGRAGENAARYHGLLKREALRLRRLVDDVLDFARLERGQRTVAHADDVDVAAWFDAVLADAEELAGPAGVLVRGSREEAPAHASFDREALRRAVLNLVDNALRHAGTATIDVRVAARDGRLSLVVADAGVGVAAASRKAIFEPFTRLNGSHKKPGAGLGLAIVREIAEAHGGTAVVHERAAGPGAEFEITLPLDTPAEAES